MAAGCRTAPDYKAALTAGEWQLSEMNTGGEIIPLSKRVPTISFSDSTRVFGFSGCNRYMGKYTLNGREISIDPGASTMMMCPDISFEGKFQQALREMTTVQVADQVVTLTGKNSKTTLTFIPKVDEPAAADSLRVAYQGGDGKTKMLHHLTVTYFPEEERAVARYLDQVYDLQQEAGASGARYSDGKVTLHTKGEELIFTLPDGTQLQMKEIAEP